MLTPEQVQSARQKLGLGTVANTASKPSESWDTVMSRLDSLTTGGINSSDKGFLGNTADTINQGYKEFSNLPVIKQAGQAVGAVVGEAGKVIGSGVGAIGQAGSNLIHGKPLGENVLNTSEKVAGDTGQFGKNIGEQAVPAAIVGQFGGAIPNAALAYGQGYQGASDLSQGIKKGDVEQATQGALGLGTALVGAKGLAEGVHTGDYVGSGAPKEAIQAGAKKVGQVAKDVGTKGVNRVTDMVTKPMIEPSVKTELAKGTKEEMVNKFSNYFDQAEKALKDNSEATPLQLAGNKGEEALVNLKDQLKSAGQAKQAALNAPFGKTEGLKTSQVTVPNIKDTRGMFSDLLTSRLGMQIKNGELVNAPGRLSLIEGNPADVNLIKQVDNILKQVEPGKVSMGKSTLQEVNDAVDSIQGKLYASKGIGAEPINSKTESVVKQVISDLNKKAKEVGGDAYKKANEDYSTVRSIHDDLNQALGTDANKGASLMKQLFSPNGTMPRKLFADIKEKTGIDLVNEATLAKFAMENVGDTRQANLLNEVIHGKLEPTPRGAVRYLINKGIEKIQNPKATAKRIIEKRSD